MALRSQVQKRLLVSGKRREATAGPSDTTVNELLLAYWLYAEALPPDGSPTSKSVAYDQPCALKELYGQLAKIPASQPKGVRERISKMTDDRTGPSLVPEVDQSSQRQNQVGLSVGCLSKDRLGVLCTR